jgi:hypothetical protein
LKHETTNHILLFSYMHIVNEYVNK